MAGFVLADASNDPNKSVCAALDLGCWLREYEAVVNGAVVVVVVVAGVGFL